MDVDAVLLDNGGVLTLPSPEVVAEVLTEVDLDVDPARVTRAHDAAVRASDRHPEVDAARRGFAETFVRELGADPGTVEVAAAALDRGIVSDGYRMWLSARPGAHDGLRALAGTGVALAVVSNAFGTAEEDLRALGSVRWETDPAWRSGRSWIPPSSVSRSRIRRSSPWRSIGWEASHRSARSTWATASPPTSPALVQPGCGHCTSTRPACAGDPDHDHLGSLGELAARLS